MREFHKVRQDPGDRTSIVMLVLGPPIRISTRPVLRALSFLQLILRVFEKERKYTRGKKQKGCARRAALLIKAQPYGWKAAPFWKSAALQIRRAALFQKSATLHLEGLRLFKKRSPSQGEGLRFLKGATLLKVGLRFFKTSAALPEKFWNFETASLIIPFLLLSHPLFSLIFSSLSKTPINNIERKLTTIFFGFLK